jgi:hypothetical protein
MKIWIGFDPREEIAAAVFKKSILEFDATHDVQYLMLGKLEGVFTREFEYRDGQMYDKATNAPCSTEFSFTRFLVPYLESYNGWALFCDCDMLALANPTEIMEYADPKYAVMCVKHEHHPSEDEKMDAKIQTRYFRKNWSSFVLWNCGHPLNRLLTPQTINKQTGRWLHAFGWLDDEYIGELPEAWNWLEGISPTTNDIQRDVKNVHFTRGGPWFKNWQDVEFADEWFSVVKGENEEEKREDPKPDTRGTEADVAIRDDGRSQESG